MLRGSAMNCFTWMALGLAFSAAGLAAAVAPVPPLAVRGVALPLLTKVAPGLPLPGLKVVIRNATSDQAAGTNPPQALVLRAVEWSDGPGDTRPWIATMMGVARENPAGGLTLNSGAAQTTQQRFERGLLLPGDELSIPLPTAPQSERPLELRVRYAWVGEAGRWPKELLVPVLVQGGVTAFAPATPSRTATRGNQGGLGVWRKTMALGADPVPEQTWVTSVTLPLARDPGHDLTGGISIGEALQLAGANASSGPWHAVYVSALKTWFFTSPQAGALALEHQPVGLPAVTLDAKANPDRAPKAWKWVLRPVPAMDAGAPDLFARGEDGVTGMQLDEGAFTGVLPNVQPAGSRAGAISTAVTLQKFWDVLDRARERGLRLRLRMIESEDREILFMLECMPAK
jgi:hypothetical protein